MSINIKTIKISKKSRDINIDMCRAVFSLLIILAHVNPPELILNIRSFDVTALVILSGMMIRENINRSNYFKYILKRLKKLLIPTYILILIVGVGSYTVCELLGKSHIFSVSDIMESFALVDGIGYVWIVRVYLLIAMVSPLIVRINKKVKSDFTIILISIIGILLNEFLKNLFLNINNYFIKDILLYLIPYSMVAILGLRCYRNVITTKKIIIIYTIIFFVYQISMIKLGEGFKPTDFKYPPNLYYLSYGVMIGLTIYYFLIKFKFNIKNIRILNIVQWVSENSFTIYLSHIVVLMGVNVILSVINISLLENYLLKYIIVCLISILITYSIEKIKLIVNNINN